MLAEVKIDLTGVIRSRSYGTGSVSRHPFLPENGTSPEGTAELSPALLGLGSKRNQSSPVRDG